MPLRSPLLVLLSRVASCRRAIPHPLLALVLLVLLVLLVILVLLVVLVCARYMWAAAADSSPLQES